MNLREYLMVRRIHPDDFAKKSNLCVRSIYRYMNGMAPQLRKAWIIEESSNGEVTVEELRGKKK